MKAIVEQTLDSTWANAVTVKLEAELDNPHSLTTKEIASLMIYTIRMFMEEVRAETERHIYDKMPSREVRQEAELRIQQTDTDSGRERDRYEEMQRSREAPDNVRGGGEG